MLTSSNRKFSLSQLVKSKRSYGPNSSLAKLMAMLFLALLLTSPFNKSFAGTPELSFLQLHHVEAQDVIQFFTDTPGLKEYIADGRVKALPGKTKSLVLTLDKASAASLIDTIRRFESMMIQDRVVTDTIRINYAAIPVILETLSATGICQVWHRTEELKKDQTKHGNRTVTHEYKKWVYSRYDMAKGNISLAKQVPEIPYVIEIPHLDPVKIPPVSLGQGTPSESFSLDFPNAPSTEDRNRLLVVGTPEHIEHLRKYIKEIDKPARQIMVEVQIIELSANKLNDLGVDLFSVTKRHNTLSFATPLPGESIPQPSGAFAPITQSGLALLFDDQQERASGQFLAGVHALVRNGEAVIKARPKLYTLDDRQNILHVGEQVPTFQSTAVNRDVSGGNFVEEVNSVGTQYVGITVNVRPRISGTEENEVSMLIDVQVNNITGRDRVFDEDLLGVPTIAVRQFRGQARLKNHRPLILGGMIREEEVVSRATVPLLGDIPYIGDWIGRKQTKQERRELIMVLTPHILSETGIDPVSTPKESLHFDTFNSVLFNDRYILKGRDLVGLDPISRAPIDSWTRDQVLDLTLLNIVKKRELVRKLRIFKEYLPEGADSLSLYKRSYPEKSVRYWNKEQQKVFFRAAAIVVENIKSLNPDLDYDELTKPRREIVIPTSPYHVSLSYEKLKPFYEKGGEVLMRGGGKKLSEETLAALRGLGGRGLGEFAEYMKVSERTPAQHGAFRKELENYYLQSFPDEKGIEELSYSDFFKKLDTAGINFISIATYFDNRLSNQLQQEPPRLGMLEQDLELFVSRHLSLEELAENLQELDHRWQKLSQSADRPVQGL